jgi:hypothetical protein
LEVCVELFGAYNAPNGCMQHATSTAQWMWTQLEGTENIHFRRGVKMMTNISSGHKDVPVQRLT